MPSITAISPQKTHRNRFSIFIDNRFYAGVDVSVAETLRLKVGMLVDEQKLATILEQEEYQEAKQYLFRLLSRRLYSSTEVKKKLTDRGYDPELIKKVITEFLNQGWLDDTQFATQWVESRLRFKPRGISLIRRELMLKGIEKEIIEEVLSKHIDSESEYKLALAALNKKKNYTAEKDPFKRKRKIYAYLARKGFNLEIIEQAMNQLK